jgi:hemerythrin-like domain-containing protein
MDAITFLRSDHKSVQQLFKRFESAGDHAYTEKRAIVDQIIEELSVHAAIEEQVFYPVARATVPNTDDIALESLEEHHIVKWLLSELVGLDPTNERFDAKVTVLIENVRHHVEEEESEFFPKVRGALGRKALMDLGDALADAKKVAPTHPHPRSPAVPPGNSVVGAIAGAVDRVSDNISGIAQGTVSAAQDLIARIGLAPKPKTSPSGSSVARTRAKSVRRAVSVATGGSKQTARAKSTAAATAGSAASGTKSAAKTAKEAVRASSTSARRTATSTGRTAKAGARKTAVKAKRTTRKTAVKAKRTTRKTAAAVSRSR